MFSLRDFIKSGFIKAVGKMADYQIILNAVGWHEKGVLTEEDLQEIQIAIEEHSPMACFIKNKSHNKCLWSLISKRLIIANKKERILI